MKEIWKPIEHFPGYLVSNLGNFRSIDREFFDKNGHIRRVKGHPIKLDHRLITHFGFLPATVRLRRWGKTWNMTAYELVGRAFLPRPDDYEIHPYEVKQINYDPLDVRLVNLEFKRFYLKDREGNIVNPDWEYPEGRTKWMNDKLKKRWEEYFADRDDAYLYPVEDYYI